MFVVHPGERSTQTLCGAWDIDHMVELLRQESQHQTEKKPRSLLDAKFVEGISSIMLLNCVSGVRSDLETQQVVEQFSYMSKIYFLVFHYS